MSYFWMGLASGVGLGAGLASLLMQVFVIRPLVERIQKMIYSGFRVPLEPPEKPKTMPRVAVEGD